MIEEVYLSHIACFQALTTILSCLEADCFFTMFICMLSSLYASMYNIAVIFDRKWFTHSHVKVHKDGQ